MASRGVDALANRAAQLDLNDGPTLLGEGAFGKVYKETRTVYIPSTKVCAVKKIENFDKEAVKEVETLMKLNHKYIIKCYGHHYEDNGRRLCIVMEYADQGTFTKVVTEEAQKLQGVQHLEISAPPLWCPGLPAHSASANPPQGPQAIPQIGAIHPQAKSCRTFSLKLPGW